jgi:hypothetical protein
MNLAFAQHLHGAKNELFAGKTQEQLSPLFSGGEGEIRTHGTLAGSTVFETVFAYYSPYPLLPFDPSKSITSGDFHVGSFGRILPISAPRIARAFARSASIFASSALLALGVRAVI